MYGVKGNDCYIGDPGSVATVMSAPAADDLIMWMTKGIRDFTESLLAFAAFNTFCRIH